jgi:ElaB/YqjD/DUF883 family membrane-anchored ribosome-binding protein
MGVKAALQYSGRFCDLLVCDKSNLTSRISALLAATSGTNVPVLNFSSGRRVDAANPTSSAGNHMPENHTPKSDFNRAFGDAKRHAAGVAGEASDAAQDLYGRAAESASDVTDSARRAARKTASSFEKALRNTIENEPYTAVAIALGLGWLIGRMHRPF